MTITLSRRVASPEDLTRPGDYSGPFPEIGPDLEPTGRTAVLVLTGTGPARLCSPPWEFTEEHGGSLEVWPSLEDRLAAAGAPDLRP